MVVDGDEDDGGWVEIVCDGGLLHVNVGCPVSLCILGSGNL